MYVIPGSKRKHGFPGVRQTSALLYVSWTELCNLDI